MANKTHNGQITMDRLIANRGPRGTMTEWQFFFELLGDDPGVPRCFRYFRARLRVAEKRARPNRQGGKYA